MNAKNNTEIAEVAKTQSAVDAMAVVTLSPEKYAAEVYQPYKVRLASAIDSVRGIEYDIKTTAGMAVAVKARAIFRDLRVEADKERKARKEPITKIGKLLEAGFDQVEERISPLEELFDADIKAEEARKEAEKAAKIAAERQRIEAIQAAIQRIRDLPLQVVGATAEVISAMIGALEQKEPGADFEEFIEQAQAARIDTLAKLADALAARQDADRTAAEAEEARKVEAARVEAERAELARQRAENERIANEQAAERKRLADLAAAQEAAARAQREQAEANLRAEREAQEAAIKAEQDKLAAERKALDDERAAAAKAVADGAALEVTRAEAIAADEARVRLRSAMSLEELADAAPMDELLPTDAEIREIGSEFSMTLPEWVERLDLFVISTRAELAALGG